MSGSDLEARVAEIAARLDTVRPHDFMVRRPADAGLYQLGVLDIPYLLDALAAARARAAALEAACIERRHGMVSFSFDEEPHAYQVCRLCGAGDDGWGTIPHDAGCVLAAGSDEDAGEG